MGDEVTVVGGIENTATPTGEQVVTSGEQTTTTINVGEGGGQPSEQPKQEATGDAQSAYNKSQEAQSPCAKLRYTPTNVSYRFADRHTKHRRKYQSNQK